MIFIKKKEKWKQNLTIFFSIIFNKLNKFNRPNIKKLNILVSFLVLIILIKYIIWLNSFEYVHKFPEQCTAYPNTFIKDLNEVATSYEQIENKLKITKTGAYFDITRN